MTEYDPEYFQDKFPNLYEEIEDETKSIGIDGIRTDEGEGEKAAKPERSSGPSMVDFIRLCDTEDEALEIIDHMEDQGKITRQFARKLRSQLTDRGLRSFGAKRKPGEYSFMK